MRPLWYVLSICLLSSSSFTFVIRQHSDNSDNCDTPDSPMELSGDFDKSVRKYAADALEDHDGMPALEYDSDSSDAVSVGKDD